MKRSAPFILIWVGLLAAVAWPQVPEIPPPDALAQSTEALSKDNRALTQRVLAFERQHADLVTKRSDDFALVKLRIDKVGLLLTRYTEGELRNDAARKLLTEASAMMDLVEAGKDFPPRPTTGLVEMAYLSPSDWSAQPYYLYRPEKLDPAKPVPLILFLHGYVSYMDKLNWLELTFPSEDMTKLAEETNGIVLVPFARSNTDFQGIGEQDVLETIRLALKKTPADPDRVFLGGVSMGGSGVWTIASHCPDLFAGAFPVAGRTDYYLWKQLKPSDLPRFQRWLIDKEFSISVPQNFVNLPTRTYHTQSDILVNVAHSREMDRALTAVGAPSHYTEITEGNHWTWTSSFGDPELAKWVLATKRNRFPESVRFKLYDLKANRAYWVTVDGIAKWGQAAEVTARRLSPALVEVRSSNVEALTLHLDREGMKLAEKVTVDLNGKKTEITIKDRADFSTGKPGDGPTKRNGLCGPFADVFNGKFLLVFGTKGDEGARRADQILAIRMLKDWYEFSAGLAQVRADVDVNDQDLADCNLILFGTPKTNAVLARIAPELPIKFDRGQYVIGKEKYPDSLGLVMIYPNPLSPKRYVAVCSGLHYGEMLPVNHKYDLLPDYVIFEGPADTDGTNWFRCAGFFDSHWKLDESLVEMRGPAPPEEPPVPAPGPAPAPGNQGPPPEVGP